MKNAKDRPRLGRGLGSLLGGPLPVQAEVPLPSNAEEAAAMVRSTDLEAPRRADVPATASGEVELSTIRANPHQPRRTMNETGLAELAASIKANGVIQPIVVRPVPDGFELVAGERRFRAAQRAGLVRMPAIVRDIDSHTQAQWALVENIQREDLNPIDRAEAYQTLLTRLGLTQAELATRLGEERSGIANYLRLLDLSELVRQFVREGKLSMGHAKVLAGVVDPTEQERVARLCVEQGRSVRSLEDLITAASLPVPLAKPQAAVAGRAHVLHLEKSIGRQLGLRVQLRAAAKAGKGKLTIHYGSLDQFDDLMKRLDVNAGLDE